VFGSGAAGIVCRHALAGCAARHVALSLSFYETDYYGWGIFTVLLFPLDVLWVFFVIPDLPE
jgi:hypothetical protein